MSLNVSPKTIVRDLGIGNQQLVEISKALIKETDVLRDGEVMDTKPIYELDEEK